MSVGTFRPAIVAQLEWTESRMRASADVHHKRAEADDNVANAFRDLAGHMSAGGGVAAMEVMILAFDTADFSGVTPSFTRSLKRPAPQ
jgi:hypothetical protein